MDGKKSGSPELVERMREWRDKGFPAYAATLLREPSPITEKSGCPPATGTTTTLEWIARLTSHIPDRGTHFVHYYGAYSNAHRGVA